MHKYVKSFIHLVLMEEDRAKVDVGAAVEAELSADRQEQPRVPKKRFIGRKTAAAQEGLQADGVESVENNGAIQGMPENRSSWWSSYGLLMPEPQFQTYDDLQEP